MASHDSAASTIVAPLSPLDDGEQYLFASLWRTRRWLRMKLPLSSALPTFCVDHPPWAMGLDA